MSGWLNAFAGDAFVVGRLSETRQIEDMLRVEAAYARALGAVGQVPEAVVAQAAEAIERAEIDRTALAERAQVDGMPVPGLVAQLKEALPEALHAAVHQGLTSQDVMDTALVLALQDIVDEFQRRIEGLQADLAALEKRFGTSPLMGRTRMQAALPITTGHRIAGWKRPFAIHLQRLEQMRDRVLRLQLGGPVGDRSSFGGAGDEIAQKIAEELELIAPERAWHTDRGGLAELAGWLASVTGHLGKIGMDIALMAQQGVEEASLSGGGRSSAMGHKVNPVRAELLIALGRDAAAQVGAFHHAILHEQERSGAAWTLEWLVLPRLLEQCGSALGAARLLLQDVERLGSPEGDEML